jgi:ADP-ribosyl-[dinitrogen reductase] hydrolase
MTDVDPSHRRQRVIGALVGAVVGDALGAPFEFGLPGEFSRRFPMPARGIATEMCGGRGWRPAEWTDDTQMALLIAASLLDNDGLDDADLFRRFQAWLSAGPPDVGVQTRQVLGSGLGWDIAARRHFEGGNRAAGNGSIMRTIPAAIFFSRFGPAASAAAARRISDLTHGDPAAGDGCAILHRLIAAALDGDDPLGVLPDALAEVPEDRRGKWEATLAAGWTPADATEPNGAVWPTLGTAVWALRNGWSFETAMRQVIDVGGDTDTIACVAGGLLGAVRGIQAIPSRWTTPLTGGIPGHAIVAADLADLMSLALRLDGEAPSTASLVLPDGIEPVEVAPGLWLSGLKFAPHAPADAVVISLCRTFDHITHEQRRQVYLTDDEHNLDVETPVRDAVDTIEALHAEGRPVLVHCYGGQSRTGLVLRAWLSRTRGLSADEATTEAVRLWPPTGRWNPTFDAALDRFVAGAPAAGRA